MSEDYELLSFDLGNNGSAGAATSSTITIARRNLESEDFTAGLFDDDMTLAGVTGWSVWECARGMVTVLKEELGASLAGKRVVELGSGTGLAGLAAASLGAHVLLTDLKTVTEGIIIPNIHRNEDKTSTTTLPPPSWTGSVRVGHGTVVAQPLDWTKDIALQTIPNDPREAEVIIAADTIFLLDILEPFVQTLATLLRGREKDTYNSNKIVDQAGGTNHGGDTHHLGDRKRIAYFAYIDRSKPGSKSFASLEVVTAALAAAGIVTTELRERTMTTLNEQNKEIEVVWRIFTLAAN